MHLDDLLASPVALPSIPRVIALLLNELNQEEPDLRVVSTLISSDIGLTTRLLQLANSAQFQLTQKIGSVTEALAVLGLRQVHALATAAAVAGAFKTVPGIALQDFWRYSLDVAKLSRTLARYAKANPSMAFTAGLIHAVGELVMHMGMPDQMRWLNERIAPLATRRAEAEIHLLGYCYADVGAGFAMQWAFPTPMVDAVKYQHTPFDNDRYEALAGVVHLSAWRARAKEAGWNEAELTDGFPDAVALTLGIDFDHVLQQSPIDWTTGQESAALL